MLRGDSREAISRGDFPTLRARQLPVIAIAGMECPRRIHVFIHPALVATLAAPVFCLARDIFKFLPIESGAPEPEGRRD